MPTLFDTEQKVSLGRPAPQALPSHIVPDPPQSAEPEPIYPISGLHEDIRDHQGEPATAKPQYKSTAADQAGFRAAIDRAVLARLPYLGNPYPTLNGSYGTTVSLFTELKRVLAKWACVDDETSVLLGHWVFSTWFPESLDAAPCLILSGDAERGDRILRVLRELCHRPNLMTGLRRNDLMKVGWMHCPTLLIYEPHLSKEMAVIVGCSTHLGYAFDGPEGCQLDLYGPKAIFVGEERPPYFKPHCSLHLVADAHHEAESGQTHRISREVGQKLVDRLFDYRLKYLGRVYDRNVDVSCLPSELRELAHCLCACIIDAPELEANLLRLLTPMRSEALAETADSIEGTTVQATLNLARQGKPQVYVSDIARELNGIRKRRGETDTISAEKVGHRLKKIGLCSRRLSAMGNGLDLNQDTLATLAKLSVMYLGEDCDPEAILHTNQAADSKQVMEEM